jgi:hypothetical protein
MHSHPLSNLPISSPDQQSAFRFLPDTPHGISILTNAKLTAIDAYLRTVGKDDKRAHVLACFTSDAQVNSITGLARNWAGWSGLTLTRKRWNWQTCCVDARSNEKVDLSLCRVFADDLVMFGLIVHELSHASGTKDGDPDVLGTASNWERVAQRAWRKQFTVGTADERDRAFTLARLLR